MNIFANSVKFLPTLKSSQFFSLFFLKKINNDTLKILIGFNGNF
jgi:hypothetical protein